jgi:hypothetical protein
MVRGRLLSLAGLAGVLWISGCWLSGAAAATEGVAGSPRGSLSSVQAPSPGVPLVSPLDRCR